MSNIGFVFLLVAGIIGYIAVIIWLIIALVKEIKKR